MMNLLLIMSNLGTYRIFDRFNTCPPRGNLVNQGENKLRKWSFRLLEGFFWSDETWKGHAGVGDN